MVTLFAKNWWMFALRGLFAILFGILAIIWPSTTLSALILLFAVYVLADGLVTLYSGFTDPNHRLWLSFLEGSVSISAGIVAFIYPALTAVALLYLIAAWAILTGILEIAAAVRLRQEISGEWFLALTGGASIAFGIVLAIFPGVGLLTTILLISGYAIAFGIMTFFLALNLRKVKQQIENGSELDVEQSTSAFSRLPLFYGRLRTPIYKPAPMAPTVNDMAQIDQRPLERQA